MPKDDTNRDELARSVASFLLKKQWVYREKNSKYYHFISKNKSHFLALFDALNMSLIQDHDYAYFGIISRGDGELIKLKHTIILLILRKLYDIEASEGRNENGRVSPPSDLILQEYQSLGKELNQTEMSEIFDYLKRRGVIEIGSKDPETHLQEITILPTIRNVVTEEYLSTISEYRVTQPDVSSQKDESAIEAFSGATFNPNEITSTKVQPSHVEKDDIDEL